MQEPKPKAVLPPSKNEPRLRVGVVIAEDKRTRLSLKPLNGIMKLQTNGKSLELAGKQALQAELSDPSTIAVVHQGRAVLSSQSSISLCSPKVSNDARPEISVDPVVAGRGFHWQKDLSLSFAGDFEICIHQGFLELINIIPFENYIGGVISSEMAAGCPLEFMKAQAVAARSWSVCFLTNKHPGRSFEVCNDDDCQRYQGCTHLSPDVEAATAACRGEFLVDAAGSVCPAYYSKSCGGVIEDPESIFGFKLTGFRPGLDSPSKTLPDLANARALQEWIQSPPQECFCSPQSVPEGKLSAFLGAVDQHRSYFRWHYEIGDDELAELLRNKTSQDVRRVDGIEALARSVSARIVRLRVDYSDSCGKHKDLELNSQYEIRRCLSPSFLLSSAFLHRWNTPGGGQSRQLVLDGAGWGHGVGLCQIGAVGMALRGNDYRAILKHYYPGYCIVKSYD